MSVFPESYGWTCSDCALRGKSGQHGRGFKTRAEAQAAFDAHPCAKLDGGAVDG